MTTSAEAPTAVEDLQLEPNPNDAADAPPPIHQARCMAPECGVAVRYQPTVSGAGFTLPDGGEQVFGVGEQGRPVCPNGHGEMAIADDQLPNTAEAFALAQEKLAAAAGHAEQQRLPGVVMPFNFQGAYLELEDKAVEVDRLHADYKAIAEEARDAKKAWEKAAELHVKMAIECRRRRRAKEGEPSEDLLDASEREPATNLVRCKWEEQHPDESCPLCSEGTVPDCPRDSIGHVDEIEKLLETRTVMDVREALEDGGVFITESVARGWTAEQRAEVLVWATPLISMSDGERVEALAKCPPALGTGHHAADAADGAREQVCQVCGAVLIALEPGQMAGVDTYTAGSIVGVDCPGKAKADGQHYIGGQRKGRRKKPQPDAGE